jgi:hypothetical protein
MARFIPAMIKKTSSLRASGSGFAGPMLREAVQKAAKQELDCFVGCASSQ